MQKIQLSAELRYRSVGNSIDPAQTFTEDSEQASKEFRNWINIQLHKPTLPRQLTVVRLRELWTKLH